MSPTPQPILLEVLARVPTDFFHCLHCEQLFELADIGAQMHQEIQTSYPPEMLEEARRLATWLQDLSTRHGDRLRIRVVDLQSLRGFLKSLRYWIRRTPAFIVNGHKYVGWEPVALDRLLNEQMARRIPLERGRE